MAMNLLNAGHDVTVYNRTRKKAEALLQHGARIANTIADACRGDAVFTMLADDAALEFVTLEDGGIVDSPSYSPNQLAAIRLRTHNQYAHTSTQLGGPHFRPCR